MKAEEKKIARVLRKQGLSVKEICRRLGVSKASVSLWVRDIELTSVQKQELSLNGQKKEVIERRRITRLTRENARRQIIVDAARDQIASLTKKELFLIGICLYWAEGGKTKRGVAEFSNSDPKMVQVMRKFLTEICKVPDSKLRGHVSLHPHLDSEKAEKYWSFISGIPRDQFYKTSQQHNKASQNKKDTLPYGTFRIYVCSTELFLKIKGWTEGIYRCVGKDFRLKLPNFE